jgi:hypothetical protein
MWKRRKMEPDRTERMRNRETIPAGVQQIRSATSSETPSQVFKIEIEKDGALDWYRVRKEHLAQDLDLFTRSLIQEWEPEKTGLPNTAIKEAQIVNKFKDKAREHLSLLNTSFT